MSNPNDAAPAAVSPDVRKTRAHWSILIGSSLILAAAPLLEVRGGDRVGVRGFPQVLLPPSCASRQLFGVACPGCGLTRSFVYLAHGEVTNSLHSHHLGWLVMLVIAFQIPYRLYEIYRQGVSPFAHRMGDYFLLALLGAFIVNWLIGACALS